MVNWKNVGKNFVRGGVIGIAVFKDGEPEEVEESEIEKSMNKKVSKYAKEGEERDCYGRPV